MNMRTWNGGVLGVVCVAALGLGGCLAGGSSKTTSSGVFVSAETLDTIKVGTSTRDDVKAALGVPSNTDKLDSGEVWRYRYTRVKQSTGYVLFIFGGQNTDEQISTTSVRFNSAGVVEKVWRDGEK
ncbi:MAG: outer membrane protein assembly factor BamE [Phycisphaerales bacterium]|nr:outer membrane protein assembly factor BamE [Phycisphaerales bacterium]